MKILVLSNAYPPHYYGGYELTCRDVVDQLRAAEHQVTVLTSDLRMPGVVDIAEPHVRRDLRATWDWQADRSVAPRSWLRRYLIERRNLRAFRRTVADIQPDVLSVWHIAAISLSLLTEAERIGLPMVLTVANDWLIYAPTIDGWSSLWKRWPYRRPRSLGGIPTQLPSFESAAVNFVSKHTRDRATAYGVWRFPDAPIIPPGIDLHDFPITAIGAKPWSWRLLYVGRVDPTKGLETLVTAFAQMPATATLLILGGGNIPYQSTLVDLASQLGVADRIRFDTVQRDQLAEIYRSADVVVFPSEWDEPFGLVPLEAMACGTAVVASLRGGTAEFLSDGHDCVGFPSGDAPALAAAVTRLAGDPELRDRLRRHALHAAQKYTIDHYTARLLEMHFAVADHADDAH
ncbi:MAG TPA: glycosyltransferase family 4 protein [Mycobacteriales bacterium]|nr:glycosyltransferase family 4 protein [Mycobacteriales bacterium]